MRDGISENDHWSKGNPKWTLSFSKFLHILYVLFARKLEAYSIKNIPRHIYSYSYKPTIPLVNIQWLEAKTNYIHVKYDPQVILYIDRHNLWDTARWISVAMVTGQDISGAHTITIEVVNTIKRVMHGYTLLGDWCWCDDSWLYCYLDIRCFVVLYLHI